MVYPYLIAMGGVGLVFALWIGVQTWARRHTPGRPADCDMLEHVACGHCSMAPGCTLREEDAHQNPAR